MRIAEAVQDGARRFAFQHSLQHRPCGHWTQQPADSNARPARCAPCDAGGTAWVHLRRCLSCGAVLCCDTSSGRHARRHFQDTGHPVIASAEADERWGWCYVDAAYFSDVGAGV
jgi:uncharacterized UBP type Zn finger protein